ncbi:1255_t:CDS:2, partial [Paraglomus occultum]
MYSLFDLQAGHNILPSKTPVENVLLEVSEDDLKFLKSTQPVSQSILTQPQQ